MDEDIGPSTWHLVLFKFKDNVTEAQVAKVNDTFLALKESTRDEKPYIKRIVSGAQNSKEDVSKGYTLGFIVEFANENDRDFYVGKPFVDGDDYDKQHDEFKQFVGPLLAEDDGVLVFDFTEGQL